MKVLLFLPLVLLSACHAGPAPVEGAIPFQTRSSGLHSAQEQPGAWLICSEAQWRAFVDSSPAWQLPEGESAPPDFTQASAIFVSAGQRSSGGWSLEVLGVSAQAGALEVRAQAVGPAPDAIVTMVLTSPWQLVTIPRQAEGSAKLSLQLSERRGP
jgi:hypothetical protein